MSRPTRTHSIDALPPAPGRGRVVVCPQCSRCRAGSSTIAAAATEL